MSSKTVHSYSDIDFTSPGKRHYEVAFHHDGTWGNVLVPLTVVVGERGPGKTVAVFGGTHGNEYEGPVAVWRQALELDPGEWVVQVLRASYSEEDTPIHVLETVCSAKRHVFVIGQPADTDQF